MSLQEMTYLFVAANNIREDLQAFYKAMLMLRIEYHVDVHGSFGHLRATVTHTFDVK